MILTQIQTNPDYEALKMFLIVAGSLIMLLLSVIGYFLNKQVNASEMLTNAVNKLTTAVEVMRKQDEIRYPIINKQLIEHHDKIDDHEARIIRMESNYNNTIEKRKGGTQ